MLTLSNGYKLPQVDDTGDTFFENLSFNIQRLNDHTHDGTDSERLTPTKQTLSAASWVFVDVDSYTLAVTMPAGLTYDDVGLEFRLANGTVIYPTVTKTGSNSYSIGYTSNASDVVAIYTH